MRANSAMRKAIDICDDLLLTCKDPIQAAKAARDMSAVKKDATKDLLTLTGRPSQIIEEVNARDILKSMIGSGLLVPAQAIEGEAEVVEDGC